MTDPMKLASITVSGLRGILQPLPIEFNKSMTLVYGENGTGKTSICDALDLLGNSKCGSLDDISVGHGKHQHWPFLGQRPADVNVCLCASDGATWTATISGSKVNIASSSGRHAPTIKVWRRRQLMDLILSTPADRFRVIAPFIDTGVIGRSESALRDLLENTNRDIHTASIRVVESRETLRGLKALTGDDSGDVLAWARAENALPVENVDKDIDVLDHIIRQIDLLLSTIGQIEGLQADVESKRVILQQAQQELDATKEKSTGSYDDVLEILESAQSYFHGHAVSESCPLCESTEMIDGLPGRIDQKLSEMVEIRKANSTYQNAQSNLGRANNRHQDVVDRIGGITSELLDFLAQDDLAVVIKELVSNVNQETVHDASVLNAVRVGVDAKRNTLNEQKGRRDSLKAALSQYEQNYQSLQYSGKLKPKIERLIDIHESERKRFIDGILSSIADEVGRLYESIHPEEGLNRVALQLDPTRRASLDVQSEFLGRQVQPGAYFSNSHLDSLGLCVLIALAKMTNPEKTILVLDDILGSIDEPHVDRVVQMLYEESQNFLHTLITTHYHAWHHKIRRGQLRNADCQVVELKKWQPSIGVSLQAAGRPLVEILRANIADNPSEVEPIAANAGHLLEQLGDFLVTHYACSIPKRAHGNTLNEYLDSLKAGFIRHLRVEIRQSDATYVEVQLEPIITELKDIYQVRNTTGAHYNELASYLPTADVLRFGELVLQLADALVCADNGFPNREKNGTYWATRNETRRLHPLNKP